jgi:hypothetical protein
VARQPQWLRRALTPILDTEENIFEGFTPVKWELPTRIGMGRKPIPVDPRRKRSLFTLKTPRNFPTSKLIKAGEKNSTIGHGHKKSLDIQTVFAIVEMRTSADADAHTTRSKHVNQSIIGSINSRFPFVISRIISREHSGFRGAPSPNTLSECEARNEDIHKRTLWRLSLTRDAIAAIQNESEKNPSRELGIRIH